MDDSEEIRRFQDAVRARIERAAKDTGRSVREIPPAALLSLLCASGFGSVAGTAGPGALSARGLLGALISSAIGSMRAGRHGQPPSREELEREIFRRIQQVLAAEDEQAAALRTEIARVLEETGAITSAVLGAIETGNDQQRSDVIAAIDNLSSAFPEMAVLLRTGDEEAAEIQRRLDGQGAQFRALSEMVRQQSADVRIVRDDLASISQRQSVAGRGEVRDAARGPRWDAGCPYLGLLPFDQAHAPVFCGRQRLTTELMVKLAGRLAGPAIIVVSGASGAGKSSLLHAGLLPALAAGIQLEGSRTWPRVVMTPAGDPLTELATRLAALTGSDPAAIRRGLAADPDRAHLAVGQAVLADTIRRAGAPPSAAGRPGRLVLVVDQFEEVFTLNPGSGDAGQQAFITALCAAATRPFGPLGEPPALVVVAVRGDFWARCAAHAGLARVMQDGLFVVGPMTGPELREAITGPAAAAGLQVDANLAEVIMSDLRTAGHEEAEGILPLLSQAMMLTWGKREGNRLTVRGYNQTGGVARCVEFGAEAVYEALPDAGQHIAKEIFQALVLVSPDGQLARRPVPRADLCADRRGTARRAVDNVLEAFATGRLLVLDGDTVQIAHDVLLRAWPRLRGWLESDQANWILYTQLQEDAAQWAGHGRDSSFLYRGSQLAAVQQAAARWAADPVRYPALTQDESGFLEAGRRHAARGAGVRRTAVLALALLLIISVAGVAVAARADRAADQQRNMAVSNQLAAQSETLDATNPVAAASLAAAAWKIDPTAEARTSLLDVLAQPDRAAITAASGNISAMAFSPDGKRFATATDTGMAQVWDTATHREIGKPLAIPEADSASLVSITFNPNDTAITFHGGANGPSQFWNITTHHAIGSPFQIANDPIGAGFFSPDGKIMATLAVKALRTETATLGILDVATHRQIGPILNNAQPLAFSPDGKLLAVGVPTGKEAVGAVRVLDIATRRMVGATIPGSYLYGPDAAFSSDGNVLAVTGANSVSFWDVARHHTIGAPIAVSANQLAFSPNGKVLATISPDGVTNLWGAASHQELGGALTVDAGLNGLTFSPDSTMLATAYGSTVSFWDVSISRQIGAVIGPAAGPVAFSPNGQILAATTNHGAVLWNVATHREIGSPVGVGPADGPIHVSFSPDGKILATGGTSGVGVQLWNVATHRRIGARILLGNYTDKGLVTALAFSPDGKYLAIGGSDSAWFWDMETHRVIGPPIIYGDSHLTALAFSPDGSILAAAQNAQKNDVRLFSAATHRQIGVPLATGAGTTSDMAFSPDGSMIATASDSGVILWQVATRHQIGTPLDAGVGPVQVLAFSPDGTLLATGGEDGAVRLWDVASHEQIGSTLAVNQNSVSGIAFSPDGTVLAAANSGTTRLWGVALTKDVLNRVCAIAGGSMTKQEWNSNVKSEPFEQTCH